LNYQFQYPEALWLLLMLPFFVLLFIFYRLWKKKKAEKVGDAALVKNLYASHSSFKEIGKIFLVLFAYACGVMALANPRVPDENSGEARKGIDIVIAFDVSNSMKATDIAPDRLSKAKQFISRLIDNFQDDRMGLVIFAGNAYAQMPLTFDRDGARMYVASANPNNILSQGTSIGDALKKADFLFRGQEERFRSVILITDGETHDENALQTAKELASKGIMINTVGIGSAEGTTIIDTTGNPKKDASGQVVISKLNEQILQEIANATNGKYVHLENTEAAAKEIMGQFSQIEKKALGDTSSYTYASFYNWLALPMLLLMIAEIFLPDRKKIRR
jgi:Ca-activated chloride channel homolog